MDKYEYLTVEDLGVEKPSSVEKAKFDYSPLGKIFNKRRRLKEEDEREGLLKRLKNIEDKNEEQLRVVKNKTENIKEVTDFVKESSSLEVKGLIQEIKVIQRDVDYRKVKIRDGNKAEYDFSDYKTLKELFRDLYYRKIAIDDAEAEQEEFDAMIGVLNKYPAKKTEYIGAKNKLLINVKKFYKGRKKIIEGLKTEIFSIVIVKEQARYKEEEKNIRNENGLIDYWRLARLLDLKYRNINDELVRNHFLVQGLKELLEKLRKSRNNPEKNKISTKVWSTLFKDENGFYEQRKQ